MLRLYVIRHAEAEDTPPGARDADRRLTQKGREDFARGVEGLRQLEVSLERIFCSTLVRARETAALLAEGLPGPEPEPLEELAPGAALEDLLRALRGSGERVALVGHEPGLGRLVSLAATGRASDGTPLHKGGVARLDFAGALRPDGAVLSWLLTPKLLRRLR